MIALRQHTRRRSLIIPQYNATGYLPAASGGLKPNAGCSFYLIFDFSLILDFFRKGPLFPVFQITLYHVVPESGLVALRMCLIGQVPTVDLLSRGADETDRVRGPGKAVPL